MNANPVVSVKVALRDGDQWVLLKNDRGEWELPGGRVDADDDSLRATAQRECVEELGIDVAVGDLLDTYLYEVVPGKRVTIVCFSAEVVGSGALTVSDEHDAAARFTSSELADLNLASGYRRMIELAASHPGSA